MAEFKRTIFTLCALGIISTVIGTASASVFSVPDCNLITNAAQRLTCIAQDKALATNQYSLDKALQSISSLSTKKQSVRKLGLPNVASTYGINNDLTAVLSWRNGNSLTVKNGATLPDGWRVTRIATGLVTLTKDGVQHILLMKGASSGNSAKPTTSFAGSFLPVNGVPPPKK